jgi:hypothetical protein
MQFSSRGAVWSLLTLIACLSFPALCRAGSATTYPSPEEYLQNGRYSAYQEEARAFLKDNHDAAEAPRVALDLMVAATVLDDPVTALRMRRALLLDYTSSVPAKYVMSLFREPQEYTSLMFGVFADSVESPPPGLPGKFNAAVRAGITRFQGQALLGGEGFIAFCAAMAHESGDTDVQNGAMNLLASAGPQGTQGLAIAQILIDDRTPLADRVTKLHALPDRNLVIPFERFLIGKMLPTERDELPVLKAQADDFIFQRRLSDALPILEKIPTDNQDSRLEFWRAAAVAADGDNARGAHLLGDLAAKSPGDPWGKEAAQLQPVFAGLDRSLTSDADALLSALGKLKHQVSCVEMNASYTRDDKTQTEIYLGLISGERFEFSVRQGDIVKAACRSTPAGSSYYVDADRITHTYTEPGVVLAPTLQFNGSTLSLSNQPDWVHVPDDLVNVMSNLMKLPFVANRDALLEWFGQSIRQGKFPASATGTDVKTYVWLTPDPVEPKISRLEYGIDEAHSTITLTSGGFKITSMKFADRATPLDLKPPEWPVGKMDAEDKINRNVAASIVQSTEIALFGAPVSSTTQPSTIPSTMPTTMQSLTH